MKTLRRLVSAACLLTLGTFFLTACIHDDNPGVITHTVTAATEANGSISPANATVNKGATATFTVTPASGFAIDTVTGCAGTLTNSTYTTGAITENCTITANFKLLPPSTAATLALSFHATKTFRFTWTDVEGATHYKLLENADGNSGFSQINDDIGSGIQTYEHIVPLYKRVNALYVLQACNAAGCVDSAAATTTGTLGDAVGYIKPGNTNSILQFGTVDLSADGNTLAVGVPLDGYDDATFVIGQSIGAVYIFVLKEGVWQQQAYLKANSPSRPVFFGFSIALSSDGSTLAVGTPFDDMGDGDSPFESELSGSVFVFKRDGDIWNQEAKLKASNYSPWDLFGIVISLDGSGNTLAVGAPDEDTRGFDSGAVYLFDRANGLWTQNAQLKASNVGENDAFGRSLSLSADGKTLAVASTGEDGDATGINGDQSNDNASDSGAVYVFVRENNAWIQQAYIKASNTATDNGFGISLSIASNGGTLAIGAKGDDGGTVFIFRREGNSWSQSSYLKGSNTEADDAFYVVDLSADGQTLAVGAPGEDSAAVDINGDQTDNTTQDAGAVYVFSVENGEWVQQAYVKASNSEAGDEFGALISLSADGNTLAVGVTIKNGDPTSNEATDARAVYLY